MMAIALQVTACLNTLYFPVYDFLFRIDACMHGTDDNTQQHGKQMIYVAAGDRSTNTAGSSFWPEINGIYSAMSQGP